MSIIRNFIDFIDKFSPWRSRAASSPPTLTRLATPPAEILIDSGCGEGASTLYVPEGARRQAAENMRRDPVKRVEVESLLARKLGSMEAGIAESRRRYPEAYR